MLALLRILDDVQIAEAGHTLVLCRKLRTERKFQRRTMGFQVKKASLLFVSSRQGVGLLMCLKLRITRSFRRKSCVVPYASTETAADRSHSRQTVRNPTLCVGPNFRPTPGLATRPKARPRPKLGLRLGFGPGSVWASQKNQTTNC